MTSNQAAIEPVIVLVDDDAAVAHALKFSLELDGFAVRTYPDAESLLADGPLPGRGCLVLDARLPGLDGLDLLAELRRRGTSLPAIVITTAPNAALRARAAAAHATIVEKPLLGDVLLDVLKRELGPPAPNAPVF